MDIHLTQKRFGECTPIELRILRQLRLKGKDNSFLYDLFLNPKSHARTPICIARSDRGIAGWGARTKHAKTQETLVHVFVKPSYRRRGIGTMLHDELNAPHARVWRFDARSTKFYDAVRRKRKCTARMR